jgi:hypothetical protein
MPPRIDTIFRFPGPTGQRTHCRIRIHAGSRPDGSPLAVPVVIASELGCNPGQRVRMCRSATTVLPPARRPAAIAAG